VSARKDLVATGRRLVELGLSPGASGNLSVREGDHVVITPTGALLGELDVEALSVLDLDGRLVDGPKPSKEFPLHLAMYRRGVGVDAVVHLHSPHAAAVSCLPAWSRRSAVPPLTPYFVMRVGQTPLVPYASPGDPRQARHVEELDFDFRAALLQNHGSLVAATGMAAAADAAVELEEVCRLLLLLAGREPRLLSASEAAELAARYGTAWDPEPLD
jgi:ribulose-5-phosphate 4-epimerase/fuculose-1-phosphate aldolase